GPVDRNEGYSSQLTYHRANFRTNLDIDITDHLLFQTDLAGSFIETNRPGGGGAADQIFNGMYQIPSAAFPVKLPNGHWGGTSIYGNNPMAMLTAAGYGQPNARNFSLRGRLRQELDSWLQGLSAEVEISYYNVGKYNE